MLATTNKTIHNQKGSTANSNSFMQENKRATTPSARKIILVKISAPLRFTANFFLFVILIAPEHASSILTQKNNVV